MATRSAMYYTMLLVFLTGVSLFINVEVDADESSGQIRHGAETKTQSAENNSRSSEKSEALNNSLINAVAKGNASMVRNLLDKGADLEARDSGMGATALIWAAFLGKTDLVDLFLEKGANVNAVNKKGWTPLLLACAKGHHRVVEKLLEKDVNIDVQSSDGWTPFKIAYSNKDSRLATMLAAHALKSPWAETYVTTSGKRDGCAPVRRKPSGKAKKAGCLKPGTKISLTGIWVQDKWAQLSKPAEGWIAASRISRKGIPGEKRFVLSGKRSRTASSTRTNVRRRNRQPQPDDQPVRFYYDPDLEPGVPLRRDTWR